ncbi:MAG TPA: nitrate ABC transporter permease [Acetobacteraceae bacterium]|jgi:NitT/TauT family transport system permease protein|nr:nitrate ABC transporter permease [Acetobacteraceae bacterium]
MTRSTRIVCTRWGVSLGLILLLEAACRSGVVPTLAVLPPSEMFAAMLELLSTEEVLANVAATFSTVAVAFLAAVLIGFAAGVALHGLPRFRRAIDPLLASYYSVPIFVFYPLLVALFGLSALPLIAIGFLAALPAMLIATLLGLDRVPPVLRRVARMHRLGSARTAALVILPAALPNLFQGIKLSLAYAFIGVIAGEFILSGGGLGYAIAYAYESFDNRTMYGLMLFVLLSAVISNTLLSTWESRLQRRRWRA